MNRFGYANYVSHPTLGILEESPEGNSELDQPWKSMVFEILTIYPGHFKGLHDHASTLRFGKYNSYSGTVTP